MTRATSIRGEELGKPRTAFRYPSECKRDNLAESSFTIQRAYLYLRLPDLIVAWHVVSLFVVGNRKTQRPLNPLCQVSPMERLESGRKSASVCQVWSLDHIIPGTMR